MDIADSAITVINGIRDAERRCLMLRRFVLNEAFFNSGILDVLRTKALAGNAKDRDRLILRLRTGSRDAHALFSVEKGAWGRMKDTVMRWIVGADAEPVADFAGWTETEIYHYVLNKIDVLKALVEAQLAGEPQLGFDRRLDNIRHGLQELIRRLRA